MLEYGRDVHIEKYWDTVDLQANSTSNRNVEAEKSRILCLPKQWECTQKMLEHSKNVCEKMGGGQEQ